MNTPNGTPAAFPGEADLELAEMHTCLDDPLMESMNFLNEVANRYPRAISFAPGRPYENLFNIEQVHAYMRRFADYLREVKGYTQPEVRRAFFQYGRTKGIIHELIAACLQRDEGIVTDPESVIVTVGTQEALFLALRALRADERDALLVINPAYVGVSGAARLVDMLTIPVPGGPQGADIAEIESAIRRARSDGLRPRACYVVPDFANPSGISLTLATRHALLELASRENILLLEDNPYSLFTAGTSRPPTLKALDTAHRVVYLGSFAKTGLPGARVGFAVADQTVCVPGGSPVLLADQLSKIKSMLTVNTSPIAQAVIAGRILEHDYSLVSANQREARIYRNNLHRMLDGLASHFPEKDVSWNVPGGGFFLVLSVPFDADDRMLERSARDHGVLWTPMSHFYEKPVDDLGRRQLRLSFSLLTGEQIDTGLARLAAFVREAAEEAMAATAGTHEPAC